MTDKIAKLYAALLAKDYRKNRKQLPFEVRPFCKGSPYSNERYMTIFRTCVEEADPLFLCAEDEIGFNKSCIDHVAGWSAGNYSPNYGRVISTGFDRMEEELKAKKEACHDPKRIILADYMLESLALGRKLADKYRDDAEKTGKTRLYQALTRIPGKPADSFYEACVFIKLCVLMLRLCFSAHLTFGRFDQYMLPFYEKDLARGVSEAELFETLEEFFIALNVDSDCYHGVQAGDNGQSMVLGGFAEDGTYQFNALSEACLRAACELKRIDPKINLRVGKNTPDYIYELGTELTKEGLGFPQYCNDDVVIPGLIKLGYAKEDAYNYVVAACWEFIIPNVGADIPNICFMNFALVSADVLRESLMEADTFEDLMAAADRKIEQRCSAYPDSIRNWAGFYDLPTDMLFLDGAYETLSGFYNGGGKYNNYGCHGPGISVAADSFAAVKRFVYEEKSLDKETLLAALDADFEGFDDVRALLQSGPKMGNHDDYVDDIAVSLMDSFCRHIDGLKNDRGGIFRPGTGSAAEYVSQGLVCPATADGRHAGDVLASSFSPAIGARTEGLLSVMHSFTKFDMQRIVNGGPLTIEIHDSVFRNEIGVKKTAALVKAFIELGGHQLQLNSINRDILLDAQKHPEQYQNLVVRVWGWSGYFVELAPKFQNHIIRRLEFTY